MLPKSKRRIYVGYDDGSNPVKYYNAETRKVLTSQNFRSLQLPMHPKSLKPMVITPNIQPEGSLELVTCHNRARHLRLSDRWKIQRMWILNNCEGLKDFAQTTAI